MGSVTEVKPPGNVLLSGIVGSTAYGLAHEGSDVDRLGCYAAPTIAFHGLHPPAGRSATWVSADPDAVYHEAGKLVSLILGGNPTVTEILWLNSYETETPLGRDLIAIRGRLTCARAARDAYLGYATQQFRRIENRGDGSFSADTRKRTAKHARHLWRLLYQGTELHQTGHLPVLLSPNRAASCRAFGERVENGDLDVAWEALRDAEEAFGKPGVLPERPDETAAEAWLHCVRAAFYGQEKAHAALPEAVPYSPRPGTLDAVICDIDGTLAIHQGRSPYDYARCGEDALNHVVADYLRTSYGKHGGMRRIILLSGRPETARADTQTWLARHRVPFDELHMRADGDFRNDVIVKRELFDAHVRDRFHVRLVLDDRSRVVALWRSLGIPCWQVNEGDF